MNWISARLGLTVCSPVIMKVQWLLLTAHYPSAVSYTHLDVYKRQHDMLSRSAIYLSMDDTFARWRSVRHIVFPDSQTPVSYTHLDVYKRQVPAGNIVLYRPKELQKYEYYGEDKAEVYWRCV